MLFQETSKRTGANILKPVTQYMYDSLPNGNFKFADGRYWELCVVVDKTCSVDLGASPFQRTCTEVVVPIKNTFFSLQ